MKFKKDRFNNAFPKVDDVEKDDVLYDKIWDELLDSCNSYDEDELQRGFDDVRQRIKSRKKKKRAMIYISVSSVASILIFVFIALKNDRSSFEVTHVSNLAEMGVKKKDNQVQLYLGDSVVSNLEESAIISKGDSDNVELKTNDGVSLNWGKTSIAKIYVPSGKRFDLELSDGTKVTLNSNTWLEYPTSFEYENERRIKINGEAYFDVSRVASATLLKDAASTAIYGSRAANGVLVVETKVPEKGSLALSYRGDYSIATADLTDYNLMNAREKLEFQTHYGMLILITTMFRINLAL